MMPIYDAAMRYQARGHAAGDLRRQGIRHRLVARLGGQGHEAARRPRRDRRRASSASTAPTWSAWACCRCSSPRASAGRRSASTATRSIRSTGSRELKPRADADVRDLPTPTARRARCRLLVPHRYARRARVLPQRRHPALRAAQPRQGGVDLASRLQPFVASALEQVAFHSSAVWSDPSAALTRNDVHDLALQLARLRCRLGRLDRSPR